ncbi:MAG: hypothetical protein HOJ31_10370 [Anaerolineae bacterium]|nr:hypothetical protein [Anaerolineae bacterium]
MSEKTSKVEPENYLLNLIIGLQIMSKVGADNLSAGNGIIFCGYCVDTNEEEELLHKLGWEYDEDNGEFYYLVKRTENV